MKIDRNILIHYFSGESSDEEKNAIQKWLESDEKHKRQFINERIRFDASLVIDENNISLPQTGKIKRMVWNTLKIASAILILIGSSYFFSNKSPEIIQNIYVPTANRTSLTLADGTLVWLNSNTTLKYPSFFSGKERIVELNGEAYFEVTPNKKAFIVKTSKYNVEALGTAFNIEDYADKPTFSTALFSGKVRIYKDMQVEDTLYLDHGKSVELVDNILKVSPIDTDIYRWRDGLIIIEDKSFEEIMLLFEKYFGQEIIIQNKRVKQLGYRGKLRIADGVDHALRVLQNDFHFTYKRDEDINRIYIY